MDILNKTSIQIALEYKELRAFVYKLPTNEMWKYGSKLKLLENAFIVVRESEQIRSK